MIGLELDDPQLVLELTEFILIKELHLSPETIDRLPAIKVQKLLVMLEVYHVLSREGIGLGIPRVKGR